MGGSTKLLSKFSLGNFFSTLAKSVQLPIAVLPVAGLLLRFGQDDLLGAFGIYGQFLAGGANAIFSNLPLIFAVAMAIGFSRDSHGSAALAGAVGYLVLTGSLQKLAPQVNIGILGGIVAGVMAGMLYNRFSGITLPPYLAFFSGKRFVPIITAFVAVLTAILFSFVWPGIQYAVDSFGLWMTKSGNIGLFFYGFFNRMLLPLGLHNIINTIVWFQLGEYTNAAGEVVTGDITRYLSGDPTAGYFMAGFFPVMMFGLPAACFAMLMASPKENRNAMSGIFVSLGLTSLITGVTEPIEYAFMFLAFPLYIIHAVLTGLSMVIMHILQVRLGFTFSAGLIDFFLNAKYGAQTKDVLVFGSALGGYGNLLWGIIMGAIYAVLYYVLFTLAIRVWNLKTPGRTDDAQEVAAAGASFSVAMEERAQKIFVALGGMSNIKVVDACATRLRVDINENSAVDEAALKAMGVMGVVNKIAGHCQVIVGTDAAQVSDAIKAIITRQKS
ncbi:MAG: PTS transporter subunit EIIC [Spirochaetia bacterium]